MKSNSGQQNLLVTRKKLKISWNDKNKQHLKKNNLPRKSII